MILILTDKFDKHADLICLKLHEIKADFFRFDLDSESLRNTSIDFDGARWLINQNSVYINSNTISCVWVRRPFMEVSLEEENTDSLGFKIWRGEWNKTLLGFYNSIKSLPWLNPLARAYQAENKYLQTEYANSVGFNLPNFIVSNDRRKLIDFTKKHNEVVMKLMHQDFYKDTDGNFKGIYVNKITIDDLQLFTPLSL